MIKAKKIWLNGKFIDWDKARVHVLTNTLHYGSGAFEGVRCYKTKNRPAIFRLNEHIDRLFYSAECLGIKASFSKKQVIKSVLLLVKYNKLTDCYIRPIIFCGYGNPGPNILDSPIDIATIAWPLGSYLNENVKTVISKFRRLSPRSVVIDAKICGYYANSVFATMEAKKLGVDEAILLDDGGHVAEGAGENIFIVKNRKLYTPPRGAILPGITRDSVFNIAKDFKISLAEKKISVRELLNADEVFFTGTAVEIRPVVKINSRKIINGKPGPVTLKIKSEYARIVRGENKKYNEWLTYV